MAGHRPFDPRRPIEWQTRHERGEPTRYEQSAERRREAFNRRRARARDAAGALSEAMAYLRSTAAASRDQALAEHFMEQVATMIEDAAEQLVRLSDPRLTERQRQRM
jgi:hypothetical protein